ncbi:MAG: MaoC family dehydratase N-terminal domain-containing protein [Deltaproteobacteria bacterium]|nr:MaoC family dehydratase N-terminal domain-containing protein [Deltaproteobacteria bacterium]
MILNSSKIGKTYEPDFWDVTEASIVKFASGYNDLDNPRFKDGRIAPPMYAVLYAGASVFRVLFDDELNINMMRLVHGEQDMTWHRLPRPGDRVKSVASVHNMEEKSSGEILHVKIDSSINDAPAGTIISSFFIRGKKKDEKPAEKKPEAAPPPRPPVAFSQKMYVTNDQTYRYAEGGGDHNPIHIDNDYALAAGLPGIILQGLCTMAFAHKAVTDKVLDKDPEKLRRLFVRFSKPVVPYDVLTTEGWVIEEKPGRKVVGLEVKNQDGVQVLINGRAEVDA